MKMTQRCAMLNLSLILLVFQLSCASNVPACITAQHDGSASAVPYNSFVGITSVITILSNTCEAGVTEPCVTYKVILGSGSIVYRSKSMPNVGYVMTAKHVCDHRNDRLDKNNINAVDEHMFSIRDQFNRDHTAKYYFSSSKKFIDVCVLIIEDMDDTLAVAELAATAPNKGDIVYNIAAPGGFLPNGVALTFSGYYSGSNSDVAVYTIASANGSSGSPIFNKNGKLVGLIWSYPVQDDGRIVEQISFSVPFNDLASIINSIDAADAVIEMLVKKLDI